MDAKDSQGLPRTLSGEQFRVSATIVKCADRDSERAYLATPVPLTSAGTVVEVAPGDKNSWPAGNYLADCLSASPGLWIGPLGAGRHAGAGKYNCMYTPRRSGVYEISVVGPEGGHIQQSPFTCRVSPGKKDRKTVHVPPVLFVVFVCFSSFFF